MARDEEEYKQWQDAYDEVEGEWDEDWSNEEKQQYYENLQVYNEEYVDHFLLPSFPVHYSPSKHEPSTQGPIAIVMSAKTLHFP